MSKKPSYARSCKGKIPYEFEGGAKRKAREHGPTHQYYKCRYCPAWHVGHARRRK